MDKQLLNLLLFLIIASVVGLSYSLEQNSEDEDQLKGPYVCEHQVETTKQVFRNESYKCLQRYFDNDCGRLDRASDIRRTDGRGCWMVRRGTCYKVEHHLETVLVKKTYCCHGYEPDGNHGCKPSIPACQQGNGGCDHLCAQQGDSYECQCWQGFLLNSDGKSCTDIDECESKVNTCEDRCHNTDGSYYCSCDRPGYTLADDRYSCRDTNECDHFNGMCEHNCINTDGAFYCTCSDGFKLVDGFFCQDRNECSDDSFKHLCEICVNDFGGFHCECPENKKLFSDNRTCIDINTSPIITSTLSSTLIELTSTISTTKQTTNQQTTLKLTVPTTKTADTTNKPTSTSLATSTPISRFSSTTTQNVKDFTKDLLRDDRIDATADKESDVNLILIVVVSAGVLIVAILLLIILLLIRRYCFAKKTPPPSGQVPTIQNMSFDNQTYAVVSHVKACPPPFKQHPSKGSGPPSNFGPNHGAQRCVYSTGSIKSSSSAQYDNIKNLKRENMENDSAIYDYPKSVKKFPL